MTFDLASVTISYRRDGIGPSVVYATPNPLRFSERVGTMGERPVTLTNVGTVPVSITGATISGIAAGDFAVGRGCATPVPAGASCQLVVRFAPRARGYRAANVAIATNVSARKSLVILAGTGRPAPKPTLTALRISPSMFRAGRKAVVSYRADVAGTVTFRVLRVKTSKGRRRLIPVGASFTRAARVGANRFRLTGRKLPPGRYRLRGYGSGPSRSVSAAFRIVRS